MDVVRLVAVRETPLSVDECLAAVAHPAAGGTAVFVGTVREVDEGRSVDELAYSAHPGAESAMRRIATEVADRFPVCGLAAVHRVGSLSVGDLAVVVAASTRHRAEAFEAARELIEQIKTTVPIWKRQRFANGAVEWVGTP